VRARARSDDLAGPAPAPRRRAWAARPTRRLVASALALLLAGACASAPPVSPTGFDFFAVADPDDAPWYEKIEDWQQRMRFEERQPLRSQPASRFAERYKRLDGKLGAFVAKGRARLASQIAVWAREEGRRHYRVDVDQTLEGDHWPTYRELAERNGDDCDGLDLIAYHLLVAFGFPREQLFRAVVNRDVDRKNHMVTLWFEDPKDPWVFDATGALTRKLRRFSQTTGWTPTAVFNEREQFSVVGSGFLESARAHP